MDWFRIALRQLNVKLVTVPTIEPGIPVHSYDAYSKPWLYTPGGRLVQMETPSDRLVLYVSDSSAAGRVAVHVDNVNKATFAGWGEFKVEQVPSFNDTFVRRDIDTSTIPQVKLLEARPTVTPLSNRRGSGSTTTLLILIKATTRRITVANEPPHHNPQYTIYLVIRWERGQLSLSGHYLSSILSLNNYALTDAGFYRGHFNQQTKQLTIHGPTGSYTPAGWSNYIGWNHQVSNIGFVIKTFDNITDSILSGVANGQFFEHRIDGLVSNNRYTLDRHYLLYITAGNDISVIDVRTNQPVIPTFRMYILTAPIAYDENSQSVIATTPVGIDVIRSGREVAQFQPSKSSGVDVSREMYYQWLPWKRTLVVQYNRIVILRLGYEDKNEDEKHPRSMVLFRRRKIPPLPQP